VACGRSCPGWEWQNPLPTGSQLEGVWGSGGSDTFAVGLQGTILHYDGADWSAMSSGTSDTLWDVWGSSGSDVFVVPGILHYDGTEWSTMNPGTGGWLFSVWGSSGTDVFVVGADGIILHYSGLPYAVYLPLVLRSDAP